MSCIAYDPPGHMLARAGSVQPALFDLPELAVPDLDLAGLVDLDPDLILVSLSGGKDSQRALIKVRALAAAAGLLDRVVCVSADLSSSDEWPGAMEIARIHAEWFGFRWIMIHRKVPGKTRALTAGMPAKRQQSLLEMIVHRGMWPDAANRWCTAAMKRGPILTVVTALVKEIRGRLLGAGITRPVRVLNVMGLRAAESPARAKLVPFEVDDRATNSLRTVWTWLPIHGLSEAEVWEGIRESGMPYHWVYQAGMPRLSCRFCVLASRSALIRAAQLDPAGARARMAVEREFVARRVVALLVAARFADAAIRRERERAARRAAALFVFSVIAPGVTRRVLRADPRPWWDRWPQMGHHPMHSWYLKRTWRAGPWFQQGQSMHQIVAAAEAAAGKPVKALGWVG